MDLNDKVPMKSGKLIVIEGLDGSGKATQAGLLAEAMTLRGLRTRQISFPNYESDSSALVRMYLSGAFGSAPSDVNAYAASSFYAVDRYAGFKTDWGAFWRDGGLLIADRYTTSNAVHQCCKLPQAEWDAYLTWLFDYEYRLLGIPRPDGVIYLRVEVEESQALMNQRYHGQTQKKDIHERDTAYLARARSAADYCAAKLGWICVECTDGGGMRSIEAIHADVVEAAARICASGSDRR